MGAFLIACAATGVALLAVWRRIGATPRGQPWTLAVRPSRMMRRAERTVDSGIVNVPRALSVSLRAP